MVKLTLLVVTVLASLPLMAQTDTTPSQGTERNEPAPAVSAPVLGSSSEPEPEDIPIEEHVVPVPAIVAGFAPALSFSSKTERSNILSGGITLGANYDDNALISSGSARGNWSYSVFPNIDIQKTTGRTRLDFAYSAGLTVNQELASQNQGSHNLDLSFLYRLSPHVNFIVNDRFAKTSGIFSQYDSTAEPQNGPASGAGFSNVPLPVANQLSNAANAQLGYQFSAEDALGFSGGYSFTNFSDAPASTLLLDNRSSQAAGFYTHRLTPRNWVGISYRFQRLTFGEGSGETNTHSVLLFHTFTLPSKLSISLFGGPEYTDSIPSTLTSPISGFVTQWSPSGGASVNFTGTKTAISVSFTHRTSDGAGYQGAVEATTIDAGLRRRLGPRWTVAAGGGYAKNDSITVVTGVPPSIRSAFINTGLERKFGEHLTVHAGYSHEFLKGQDIAFPDQVQHRNRVIFSLSYAFSRPLGR